MKKKHLLSLMLIILIAIPMSGWAQALFDPQAIKLAPSKLFPILSATDIVGAPDDAIPTETIKKISDRCKSKLPDRFTPEALTNYCACSAAATQGTVTIGELRELQKEENRKLGNATFEKFVTNVMKPCLENPIEDIEYMLCVTSRENDWRIRYPLPFCKCVSRGVRQHFEKFGLAEMMVGWGKPKKSGDASPADTLWDNNSFLNARNVSKDECVGSYMDLRNF